MTNRGYDFINMKYMTYFWIKQGQVLPKLSYYHKMCQGKGIKTPICFFIFVVVKREVS